MVRNLKVLGLALVAMFALTAVAASVASAQQGKISTDGPVTLKGEETGVAANSLTAFGLKVECPGSSYTGHKYNVTPHGFIANGETTATLSPKYKEEAENCKVTPGNFIATIDMNGCDYVIHLGVTTGGVANTYGVTFDVVCPVGKEITLTIWTNAVDHTTVGKAPFCVQHVPPQTGLLGAHATDTKNGHIDLTGTVEGIKVTESASATHPVLCPKKETLAGKFDLDVTVKGLNEAGGATSIGISE